ncbi:MAG: hypothetical protein IJS71_00280 [Clostridia bacterium]|nr:hypothetical protein [Clostridia bacterium]
MFTLTEKHLSETNHFVPAPYGNGNCAGWTVDAPEGNFDVSPELRIEGGRLTFKLNGAVVTLRDSIHSGWLHAASGGNLNVMFNVTDGDFDFFTEMSKVSTVLDDGTVKVIRVSTPLTERASGQSLGGASAHTDLYFFKAYPLVSVMTMFETSGYTPVREIYQCRATAVGGAYMNSDGGWRQLSCEEQIGCGRLLCCRDLSEFDVVRPYITNIASEKCILPEVKHDPRTWDGPVVRSGDLSVRLARTGSGLGIGSIEDKKGVATADCAAPEPLFRLLIRYLDTGREEMLSSTCEWDRVKEDSSAAGPVLRFEKGKIEVTVTAALSPEENRIGWEISVVIRDMNITAVRLDPPAAMMNAVDGGKLFMSFGPGMDVPIGKRSELHSMSPYPSIGMCMEYMCIYDGIRRRGIYNGYHDPEGSYKFLHGNVHGGMCMTGAMIPAEGIDEPANGFVMKGQDVWQIFDGDWYDATLLFRDFVRKQARWFTGVPATERDDVPEWLLKMPVWFRCDVDESKDWIGEFLKMRNDFAEMPAGIHAYCWHKIPFDTNYPHYIPEKDSFPEAVKTLRKYNVKVMPYINGRLWDTHDRGDDDWQFTSVAKPGAAKGRGGEVITEHYGSKNSKGEDVELAVMCPSSAIWQDKQIEINDAILNTLGCDAVYIDQIAAAPPVNCMDKTHAHRSGGGSWWYDHYYNLIDHLKLRAGADNCYTTESNAEPFTGHIGGMLVWHWVCAHQVPAYSVVYAGYQPVFGRNYGICPDDPTGTSFRILTAESLLFGDQPGWITPDIYLGSKYRDFFRDIVKLRYRYNEYFYAGTCLRPPQIEGDTGRMVCPGFDCAGVRSSMWMRNRDGSRIVILVNMTEEKRTVKAFPEGCEPLEFVLDPLSAVIKEI